MGWGKLQTLVAMAFAASALAVYCETAGAANYTKQSYRIPVTQPDEFGAPVVIDTDVYVPTTAAPPSGRPLITLFHGGGSSKDSEFDSDHAKEFASRGYVAILYSSRAHGNSSGQVTVSGPKELRDTFDILAWAMKIGGRGNVPPHQDFRIDRNRIGLHGYSQGGLNTNTAQVHAKDTSLNPYGIRFRAMQPGQTPNYVFQALVPNQVVKMSFGIGLLGTYFGGTQAKVAPIVDRWIATATIDQPQLYGSGGLCDVTPHDGAATAMKADLGFRSVGCFADRMTHPTFWVQAFDDSLFTPEMGIDMWRRMPDHENNRLYLEFGGHAAPSATEGMQKHKLGQQVAFFDQHLRGGPPANLPRVTYWTRDPAVRVTPNAYRYPTAAWFRQTAGTWPPEGSTDTTFRLGADNRLVQKGAAQSGSLPLAAITQDARNDPVAKAATSGTPAGTGPSTAVPATDLPGFVAGFETAAFAKGKELSGSPKARLAWTPATADTQLVLKVFDQAPDGTLTLLSRGVTGLRGRTPGAQRTVKVEGNAFSVVIPKGHNILAWVQAGDIGFYKPYGSSAGGVLQAGDASTLTLPLRNPTGAAAARGTPTIRLKVKPRKVTANKRRRFAFIATTIRAGKRVRVKKATIRFAGRKFRTNRKGRASMTGRLTRAKRYRARASKKGMRSGRTSVRSARARRAAAAPRFTG